jgi:hypothetical protein
MHTTHAVAHAIGVLALVCLAGMMLGSVKVRGIACSDGFLCHRVSIDHGASHPLGTDPCAALMRMDPLPVSVEIRRGEDLDKIIWFNLRSCVAPRSYSSVRSELVAFVW